MTVDVSQKDLQLNGNGWVRVSTKSLNDLFFFRSKNQKKQTTELFIMIIAWQSSREIYLYKDTSLFHSFNAEKNLHLSLFHSDLHAVASFWYAEFVFVPVARTAEIVKTKWPHSRKYAFLHIFNGIACYYSYYYQCFTTKFTYSMLSLKPSLM